MAQRELKITITVRPNRTSQTMHVRCAGKYGHLLLGKIRKVQLHQTLTTADTEVLYAHQIMTLADALILSP